MENDERILFATSWAVKGFLLNEDTVIDAGPFGDDEIVLRLCSHITLSQPIVTGAPDWIIAKCRIKPTRAQRLLLEELAHLISPSVDDDEIWGDFSNFGRERPSYQVDISKSAVLQDYQEHIRPQLRELMYRVSDTTYEAAMDFMRLIRWRYVKDFHFSLAHLGSIFWQAPRSSGWRNIPSRPPKPGSFSFTTGISAHDIPIGDVNRLLKANEPRRVHFDLLCEAKSFTATNPNLSLVEAVQALELGTKDGIKRLCEAAAWLAFEVPAPPVLKILQEYIPKLIKDETVRAQFTDFIEANGQAIKKIITLRNTVTHKGTRVERKDAELACNLVGNLLYKLEFASGVAWAEQAVWSRAGGTGS